VFAFVASKSEELHPLLNIPLHQKSLDFTILMKIESFQTETSGIYLAILITFKIRFGSFPLNKTKFGVLIRSELINNQN
jgi:hypothetical protein